MKIQTTTLITIALLAGFIAGAADENTPRARSRIDLDQRAREVNRLDSQRAAYGAGLSAISRETAVPVTTLERQKREHQPVGLGGLFLANEIAIHTRKSAAQLLNQHFAGKSWNEIANENNQNVATLDSKLTRIEQAMRDAAQGRVVAEPPVRDRVRAAEREAARDARSELDRQVRVINGLDDNKEAFNVGLSVVSKETATPVANIQQLQADHPNAGLGDLFIATEMATRTRKPAADFIKQHAGKSWNEIANENNQNVATLDSKLTRIEQAMRDATQGRVVAEPPVRERVRAAELEAARDARSELDRQVRVINGLDDNKEAFNVGLSVVSKETATPVATIQQLQADHPNAGLGDLFIATEMATRTRKPAADFIKQHAGGKSWREIATDNSQNLEMIQSKLSRLENAMKEAN